MVIADEKRAFEKALPSLLEKHEGGYVLFFEGEQRGIYADFDAAYVAGLDEFGVDAVFLVSRIEAPLTNSSSSRCGRVILASASSEISQVSSPSSAGNSTQIMVRS